MIVLGLLRRRAGRLLVLVGVLVLLLAVNAAAFQAGYQQRLAELRHSGSRHVMPRLPGRGGPLLLRPGSPTITDIPSGYLALYRTSADVCPGLSWGVLAGIGKVESDHGRSTAPGVRSGVNAFGCCAGPMQFNVRNGPPSTWDRYGRGGNVYDPHDAIPSAARMLCANGAPSDLRSAVYAYNHSWPYVGQVLALARAYTTGGGR